MMLEEITPSFLDELIKIGAAAGESVLPPTPSSITDKRELLRNAVVANLGVRAAGFGSGKLLGAARVSERAASGMDPGTVAKALAGKMGGQGVKTIIDPRIRSELSGYTGKNFNKRIVGVNPGSSPSIVAHELGHVTGMGTKYNPIRSKIRAMGTRYGPLGAIPAGIAAAKWDPESTKAKALPYLAALPAVPGLLEEGRASFRGLRALKGVSSRLRGAGTLLPAFGTYAARAAMPAAVAETIRRTRLKQKKRRLAEGGGANAG